MLVKKSIAKLAESFEKQLFKAADKLRKNIDAANRGLTEDRTNHYNLQAIISVGFKVEKERFQSLVKNAYLKIGTLDHVASLISVFSNLAQLDTLRNRLTDEDHSHTMVKLEQMPEAINEATSQCLITITEQIALFLLCVFGHEHPQREASKPLLLNHHLEFNDAFDDKNNSVEIAGYGPYNASEILCSVDLTAYRTELDAFLNETT